MYRAYIRRSSTNFADPIENFRTESHILMTDPESIQIVVVRVYKQHFRLNLLAFLFLCFIVHLPRGVKKDNPRASKGLLLQPLPLSEAEALWKL